MLKEILLRHGEENHIAFSKIDRTRALHTMRNKPDWEKQIVHISFLCRLWWEKKIDIIRNRYLGMRKGPGLGKWDNRS